MVAAVDYSVKPLKLKNAKNSNQKTVEGWAQTRSVQTETTARIGEETVHSEENVSFDNRLL